MPWGAPVSVTELESFGVNADFGATTDLTAGVFDSTRNGTRDLYSTTRPSSSATWDAPTLIVELSSPDEDATPWLSADSLVLYFSSTRPGAGKRDLYRADRPTATAPFSPPVPVDELNSSDLDSDPWLSEDETVIVFSRGGDTGADLYEARR